MRILMTGVSSFTGCHIARAFRLRGHQVLSLRANSPGIRGPLEAPRHEWAGVATHLSPAPFGTDSFNSVVQEFKPEVLVHHGASIDGYRRADFDFRKSMNSAFEGLESVLKLLSQVGCRHWVHSGSIFESDEGVSDDNTSGVGRSEAMSLYGATKAAVWEILRYLVPRSGISISKVVIPNPVGPFENSDRLIPVFVERWRRGENCVLQSANAVRDFLPAPWLARVYADLVDSFSKSPDKVRILRPSGWVMTQKDFVEKVRGALSAEIPELSRGRLEATDCLDGDVFERFNMEPVSELRSPESEREFFSAWARALSSF